MCGSRERYLGVVSFLCLEGTHSVVCFHQYMAYRHCCFHSLCVCLSIRRDEGHGHFQLNTPDTQRRTAYSSTTRRRDGGKRQRARTTSFSTERRSFQRAINIACLSAARTRKWRRCGNHKYQKLRFECTQVNMARNLTIESQRVKII